MQKRQIVFIHGGTAFSQYDDFIEYLRTKPIEDPLEEKEERRWQPSLREELKDTHDVYYPSMPNRQNAQYTEWKVWFERYFQFLKYGVILVGHSLGGYFLVKYLTENRMPMGVHALFLLAAPFKNDDFGGEDGGDFAFNPDLVSRLSATIPRIYIVHSTDDPVVPYNHAEMYAQALPDATLMSFSDKNHFKLPEFPELIKELRKT